MPRGGTSKQNQVFTQSQTIGNQANQQAGNLAATLNPIYQGEATNPEGFGPDLPAINTAGQQSTGGSVAAAKGAAGLTAARTGNRGAGAAVLDDSVRSAMSTNSQNALNTQKDNAVLKQTQKQAGLSGLQGMYGSNVSELLGSMGIGANVANNQASQPGWFQNMLSLITALKPTGSVGGGSPASFGIG